MKLKIMVGLMVGMLAGTLQAQTTYTWANSNVSNTPATNDWFTGGPNTQGTWEGGSTPVSSSLNTIQFFPNTTANLSYTAINTQGSYLNNGGTAFQLGTLTLNGLASATPNVNVTINVVGDALNFSASTGMLNLNSLNISGNNRNITWNVNNNIQLGTASSSSIFTLIGDGTSAFNFGGSVTQLSDGSKLIKSGTSTLTINGVVTVSGGLELNGGTLSMGNTGNAVTGGIVLNGGTFGPSNATLGNNNITVNASANLNLAGSATIAGGITLNSGTLQLASNNSTCNNNGAVTGVGSIRINRLGGGYHTQKLNSTNNTFTGSVSITGDSNQAVALNVNSLVDSVGAGNIRFLGTASVAHTFAYGSGAVAPLTLNNRRIEIVSGSSAPITIANDSPQAFTINTDLLVAATGTRTLTFGGTGAALSYFNGMIDNGTLTTLNIAKSGTGTWILSGNKTFSGGVTLSGGTLVLSGTNSYTGATLIGNAASSATLSVNSVSDYGVASAIGAAASGAISLNPNAGGTATFIYTGTGGSMNRQFSLYRSDTTVMTGVIANNGSGALILTASAFNSPGGAGSVQTRTFRLGGTYAGGTNEIQGVIADNSTASSSLISIIKEGIGTWALKGANTYTGLTQVQSGGTLVLDYGTASSPQDVSKLADGAALILYGGTLTLKDGTHTEVVLSTTLDFGGTWITRPSGNAVLRMNGITRGVGAMIDFAADGIADTDSIGANGILGGYATVAGSDWAQNSTAAGNGPVTAYASYTSPLPASGGTTTLNYLHTGSLSLGGAVTPYTLKLANSANSDSITLGSSALTFTSGGGLLYVGGSDNLYTISGTGIVGAGAANEFMITIKNGCTLAMSAPVIGSGAGSLTKFGAGTLVLNNGSLYTGITRVQQGVLRLRNATASGTIAGGIAVRHGAALELDNSITVGAEALNPFIGTGISNGGALRNITGNISTYGGTITIGAGGARINSDSGATLTINNASAVVTALLQDATIGGSGNTTVSGVISGAGNLIKDGSGTLTLLGANTYTGETVVNGGKLALGGHNVITGKPVTLNNGTLDAGSYTNTLSTLKISGSGAIAMSPGAVLTFANSSAIQWSGTLNLTGAFSAGTSLRFGTSSAGLTPAQIASLTTAGYTLSLDGNGYLTGRPSGTLIYFQ